MKSERARELVRAYQDWSKHSRGWHERAAAVFPGGDTRQSAHYAPYPLLLERGEGARVVDADGHELVDFMNNFTSLVHGHAHPAVVAAVTAQIAHGSALAAPSREQIALAEEIRARVPSVELLRFTSSGTEATQMAIRCARAATGRQRIVKMEGGYHGSYEAAEVSLVPLPGRAGPPEAPISLPVDKSVPESVLRDTLVVPFNDPERAVARIAAHAAEVACVIVEPMLGGLGMIPGTREFLAALREVTEEHGIVLVFDEVITLRVGDGGIQSVLDVMPDLTAMGKIIGGGLPIGALGGRRELMELFDPAAREPVYHASTFSGNALSMAAGLAALAAFTPAERARIERLGERLRAGIDRALAGAGLHGRATGLGSLAHVHVGAREAPRDAREGVLAAAAAGPLPRLLHLGLLRRGVFAAPRLMLCTSTAMGDREVDLALAAFEDALRELRPVAEEEARSALV